jgi:glutamine synthetase
MVALGRRQVFRILKERDVKFVRLWFTEPGNLYEAIRLTEKSELVKRASGDHVFHQFIENKKIEWDRYRAQVTDYELKEYFSIL